MSRRTTLNVAIIGLGHIGATYESAVGGVKRNHLEAIMSMEGIEPVLLVDSDESQIEIVNALYPFMSDDLFFDDILSSGVESADIVVICTPAEKRLEIVRSAIHLNPKIVVIEKPLALSLDEGIRIGELCKQHDICCFVNFPRRTDRTLGQLKRSIKESPSKVLFRYSSTFSNFGSHVIDFVMDWFSPVESVRVFSKLGAGADTTYDFVLNCKSGVAVHCLSVRGTSYSQFDCDLYFPDRRIELRNNTSEVVEFESIEGYIYPDVRHLSEVSSPTQFQIGGLSELYENIVANMNHRHEIGGCSIREGIQGLVVMDALVQSARQGFAQIEVREYGDAT